MKEKDHDLENKKNFDKKVKLEKESLDKAEAILESEELTPSEKSDFTKLDVSSEKVLNEKTSINDTLLSNIEHY